MKTTSPHHTQKLMTSAFLCLAVLISIATGGCFDQTRAAKQQHAVILEKADQDRRALDDLIRLSMQERKMAACRFDDLKASQDHISEQVKEVKESQSCLKSVIHKLKTSITEQFNQAWQEQQRTLTLQQSLLDRMENLAETVQPLPERTLALEHRQERLMRTMERRLNEVMTELKYVRQENQQLAQDNAILKQAVQGVSQDVDVMHQRQTALVDLIEAKGTGVNTQLSQMQRQTRQIAQSLNKVHDRQGELTENLSGGAQRITEQLSGIGEQNKRQLALQHRLNKTMQEAQGALSTLQTTGMELRTLLNEAQGEDEAQFTVLNEQGNETQILLSEVHEQLNEHLESVAIELSEIMENQGHELFEGMEENLEFVEEGMEELGHQQSEHTEQLQDSLSYIEENLGQAEQLLHEQFGQVYEQHERLSMGMDQTLDRLNDGFNGLNERSSQWHQMLVQLNHRANILGDQMEGFGQRIDAAGEALKLQTHSLENQQRDIQNDKDSQESVRQGLSNLGKTLDHVRDLQLGLKEQLNLVKQELQGQQTMVDQAIKRLANSPAQKEEEPKTQAESPMIVH